MADDQNKRDGFNWTEYGRLVLHDLDRIKRDIEMIYEKIEKVRMNDLAQIKTDIALLKFQAALWGTVGGSLFGAIVTFLLKLIK